MYLYYYTFKRDKININITGYYTNAIIIHNIGLYIMYIFTVYYMETCIVLIRGTIFSDKAGVQIIEVDSCLQMPKYAQE